MLTMDEGGTIYAPGYVAIANRQIRAVGPASAAPVEESAQIIDASDHLILPGLINGHQHASMALFRGIADDLDLMDWLHNYIFPAESANVDPDFVHWGAKLSIAEMLLSGTTTYADMYYFEDRVAEATVEAGMRGVLGQTIIGFPAPDHPTPEEALRETRAYVGKWRGHPLITPAVAPHAPYTCSSEVLKSAHRLSTELEVPLFMHLAETEAEVEQVQRERGKTPVRYLEQLGVLSPRMTGFHAIWLDDAEVEILARHRVGVVHNPQSNMKLASGVAPVLEWLEAGLAAGIGTDGPASNNNLDLLEEIRTAALLQKVFQGDPRALNAQKALEMATRLGAGALHMEEEIGSLEVGKKADVIILSLESPAAVPIYDPYSAIVYSLGTESVQTVIVNGRVVVQNGELLTIDLREVRERARGYREQISASVQQPVR